MRTLFLLLVITAAGAAQTMPLPHGTHRGLKLACTACHAAMLTRTAIASPAKTNLARFNHQLHLKMQIACATCHPNGARAQMAGCIVCHSKVDPPVTCEFCHPKDAALKPASHTPDFLDTHTSGNAGLDKSTCALCHGRHFTCMGCH